MFTEKDIKKVVLTLRYVSQIIITRLSNCIINYHNRKRTISLHLIILPTSIIFAQEGFAITQNLLEEPESKKRVWRILISLSLKSPTGK